MQKPSFYDQPSRRKEEYVQEIGKSSGTVHV